MSNFSRNTIKRAGSTLRKYSRGEATDAEREQALTIITAHRSSFSEPLKQVSNTLLGLLTAHGIDAEVTSRLKRLPTIIEKITSRESSLDLSRMQDIGGCRIVLSSNRIDELRQVEAILRQRWEPRRYSDYVIRPRSSGYRAVHIVVEHDHRLIEVQVRTQRMHRWAQLVEGLSTSTGVNYKQDGTSPVQDYARLVSKMYIALDTGEALGDDDARRLKHLTETIISQVPGTSSDIARFLKEST